VTGRPSDDVPMSRNQRCSAGPQADSAGSPPTTGLGPGVSCDVVVVEPQEHSVQSRLLGLVESFEKCRLSGPGIVCDSAADTIAPRSEVDLSSAAIGSVDSSFGQTELRQTVDDGNHVPRVDSHQRGKPALTDRPVLRENRQRRVLRLGQIVPRKQRRPRPFDHDAEPRQQEPSPRLIARACSFLAHDVTLVLDMDHV
jgi:hypothetical protein